MVPSEMAYKMLHQKAKALKTIRADKSIEMFNNLEFMNPTDIDLKREIAELYFRNNRFEDAAFVWFYVYTKSKDDSDLIFLVCSCLYNERFRSFLRDIKIYAFCKDNILRSAITEILMKERFFDYRYFFNKNDTMPIPSNLLEIPSDDFHSLYIKSREYITSGEVVKGLDILLEIFHCDSYLELLEFLKNKEKMELLFFLSEASPLFGRYFEEAFMKINCGKVNVLYLVLLRRDKYNWRGFLKLL